MRKPTELELAMLAKIHKIDDGPNEVRISIRWDNGTVGIQSVSKLSLMAFVYSKK